MRELGALLQRLTRDNAAIIKQRDGLAAELEAAKQQREQLTSRVAQLQAESERQQCAAEQAGEAAALAAELEKLGRALGELRTEREQLLARMADTVNERDALAQHNATLASAAAELMGAGRQQEAGSAPAAALAAAQSTPAGSHARLGPRQVRAPGLSFVPAPPWAACWAMLLGAACHCAKPMQTHQLRHATARASW